jgi:hypothetical protein
MMDQVSAAPRSMLNTHLLALQVSWPEFVWEWLWLVGDWRLLAQRTLIVRSSNNNKASSGSGGDAGSNGNGKAAGGLPQRAIAVPSFQSGSSIVSARYMYVGQDWVADSQASAWLRTDESALHCHPENVVCLYPAARPRCVTFLHCDPSCPPGNRTPCA